MILIGITKVSRKGAKAQRKMLCAFAPLREISFPLNF